MKNNKLKDQFLLGLRIITAFLILVNLTPSLDASIKIAHAQEITPPSSQPTKASALGSCPMFPQNNYWNTRVDTLPVHASSATWVNTIGANKNFHMDFGKGLWDGGPIGIPFNLISGSAPGITKYTIAFDSAEESDPGPYPLPPSPKQEWGSDQHILVVDTDDCKLYELYAAWQSGGQWQAGSGAIWDLNSNNLRPDIWTSADAAGLPILPGLARYDEVAAGKIEHALRFTTDCTGNYYIWPARHKAQYGSCANPVPFGARFRLKANYNISGFSPQAKILLQAMKTYGIVLADNGSPWFVNGVPDESWDNNQLHEIDVVKGSDFEAVDTSVLMVNYNSGATNSDTQITAQPTTPTVSTSATFNFSRMDGISTFECKLDNGAFAACTNPKSYTGLSRGTHTFSVHAINGTVNIDLNPPSYTWQIWSFLDVPNDYWAANFVARLASAGITAGCGNSNYCPEQAVTRAQMAIFIERGIHGSSFTPGTPSITFTDTTTNWARYWIEALRADGITSGCGSNTFCPEDAVTRAQMAVFLLRARHGSSYIPPNVVDSGFSDVPANYWVKNWIAQLAAEGITSGCGGGNFCPDNAITRAQMAVFLVKAFSLP